jgi:glycosyltransferase involved in cell wall biosynthesis
MIGAPKISVVTVVYNDKEGLQKTIDSVTSLNYDNIEFIVIDGGSNDGTAELMRKYESNIDYWVSEADDGIYDAMNKGIKVATGDWVNFMNAGDYFANKNVLNEMDFTANKKADILYGYKITKGKLFYPMNIKNLEIGVIFGNHQSMFFNKNKLQHELYYDEKYKIYADYELVNRIYKQKNSVLNFVNVLVADFEWGGISAKPSMQKRKDKYKIVYKSYGIIGVLRAIAYRILKKKII